MEIENGVLKKVKDEDIVNGTFVFPKGVTEIGSDAFMNCGKLKSIVIPEGITKIGRDAFMKCDQLKSVVISDSVQEIGKQAFISCKNLKSVKLPNGIKKISDSTFKNCPSLSSIEIPDSVLTIEDGAFSECTKLGNIKLSSNLQHIGNEAFCKCNILPKIDLPESLESIGVESFKECKNLRSIVIPPKITKIPKQAFYYCDTMKKVVLPEGLKEIGDHAFFLCYDMRHINIPESVNIIDNGAFKSCHHLTNITIPKNVTRLENEVFYNCDRLHNISLPEGLKFIGENSFSGCYALSKIHIPDSVEWIDNGAFRFCYFLNSAHLPKNLTTISKGLFYNCSYLRNIQIPNSVTKIEKEAFYNCKSLKIINLPEGLEEIKDEAFQACKSLSAVTLPSTLKTIGESAFSGCSKLKEFNLPENIETLNKNFIKDCKKIKSLYIPNSIKSFQNPNDSYFEFVEKADDGFIVLNQPGTDSYLLESLKIHIPLFFKYKDVNPNLLNEQKNDYIADFYNTFAPSLDEKQLTEFMKNHNFTFFKQVMKHIPENRIIDRFNKNGFYTGYYNLGGFLPESEYNGKIINYGQKVSVKMIDYSEKESYYPFDKLSHAFEGMDPSGFKKEFTDFFINNISDIMNETYHNSEFVSRAYNEFEDIQATNTNNRGSQRQLKPTVEKFKSYFQENKFRNVTPETEPIAKFISPYFDKQENFVKAVEIMNEFKDNNIPTNILSKPLKQDKNPFNTIDETAKKIGEVQESLLGNLVDIATNELSYEWLQKNDPTNLILGKLCSCCAHLHGAGFGIMHASIVHPNVQNLVVRNKEGRIIAKSTLFINPDEQFGVLNNFEVYNGLHPKDYKETYYRFMQGISDFAKQYNLEHPDKPLKQINVGAYRNDLLDYVSKYNEKSPELLKALDYADYGYDVFIYNGDSFAEQYVVWKNNELLKTQNNQLTEGSEKLS